MNHSKMLSVEPLGKCECINQFNKNIIVDALEKRNSALWREMHEYERDKEMWGEKWVNEMNAISKTHREYIQKVLEIVYDTPGCEQHDDNK